MNADTQKQSGQNSPKGTDCPNCGHLTQPNPATDPNPPDSPASNNHDQNGAPPLSTNGDPQAEPMSVQAARAAFAEQCRELIQSKRGKAKLDAAILEGDDASFWKGVDRGYGREPLVVDVNPEGLGVDVDDLGPGVEALLIGLVVNAALRERSKVAELGDAGAVIEAQGKTIETARATAPAVPGKRKRLTF